MKFKILFLLSLVFASFASWSQDDLAKKLVEQLKANPYIGECHFQGVSLGKDHVYMYLNTPDGLMDLKIPKDKLTQRGSIVKAKFKQDWMTGADSFPLSLTSLKKVKIFHDDQGHITRIKVRSVDFSLILIPSGIEKFDCKE